MRPLEIGWYCMLQVKRQCDALCGSRRPTDRQHSLHPLQLSQFDVQVDFEGMYAIEGAKEVSTVMTRHVSRLIRPWLAEQSQEGNLQVCNASMPSSPRQGVVTASRPYTPSSNVLRRSGDGRPQIG